MVGTVTVDAAEYDGGTMKAYGGGGAATSSGSAINYVQLRIVFRV